MSTEHIDDTIEFSFSYLALGLLGKNLYSNAWAALSELVANSLDAKAENVYVYIDMRLKKRSTIEVFDDGIGMSQDEIKNNYIQVGRNRRLEQEDADSVMGRKGIGKLAALYLSNHYFVISKKENFDINIYEMNFPKEKQHDNDKPKLNIVSDSSSIDIDNDNFLLYSSGTMIRMENVDLTGYGEVSNSSLNNVLSDFFSVGNLGNKKIHLKIVTSEEERDNQFVEIYKEIPFRNMVEIMCFDQETYDEMNYKYSNNNYKLPIQNHEQPYQNMTVVRKISEEPVVFEIEGENRQKFGELTGWIGIHSTINQNEAVKNDGCFKKTRVYNPLSLRIYVRNKLAISNFLPVLKNTQIYANYIEGEVGYDILDDNDFDDIATTSRQDMDENDIRVQRLKEKLSSIVGQLISSRLKISNLTKEEKKKLDHKSEGIAKRDVLKNMKVTVENIKSKQNEEKNSTKQKVIDEVAEQLYPTVLQNLKGEMIKSDYKIFFSHASANKDIVDFFYYLLQEKGVHDSEMFYSSKSDAPQVSPKIDDLEKEIKENITNNNTAVFFYTSEAFMNSEYCMFEGGAVWATRTNQDFYITFEEFEKIPDYLNLKQEFKFGLKKDTDILEGQNYLKIVDTLNFFIDHINKGRMIKTAPTVEMFDRVTFPNKVHLKKGEKPVIDRQIIEFWDEYVQKGVLDKAISQSWL